jgi:hypothetical protein
MSSITIRPTVNATLATQVKAVIDSVANYLDTPTLNNNAMAKAAANTLATDFNNSSVTIKPVTEDDITIFGPGNEPLAQQTALLHLINGPTAANLARFNTLMDDWAKKWNLM